MTCRFGAPRKYDSPEALMKACEQYFDHVDANPWLQPQGTDREGMPKLSAEPVKVPYLIQDLCQHIGIHVGTWSEWKKSREDLSEVITQAEQIIYADKYKGAAVGFYNHNIIARDLGLADKKEAKVEINPLGQLLDEIRNG